MIVKKEVASENKRKGIVRFKRFCEDCGDLKYCLGKTSNHCEECMKENHPVQYAQYINRLNKNNNTIAKLIKGN
jgi:Zn-dependent alcohol dehydrogenase